METAQTIKLIDGSFSSKEAKEILVNLINNKINFHSRRNLAVEESTGKTDQVSQKRIKELTKAREDIIDFLSNKETSGKGISIHSIIQIAAQD